MQTAGPGTYNKPWAIDWPWKSVHSSSLATYNDKINIKPQNIRKRTVLSNRSSEICFPANVPTPTHKE